MREYANAEPADTGKLPVILDVCCGTGTIGISMAKGAHAVVGVDLCESAIDDARRNAALNGLADKTCFVASAAEHVMGKMLGADVETTSKAASKAKMSPQNAAEAARAQKIIADAVREGREIVAIVDPPRPGLHKNVIKALRCCANLKSFVYVSCNPTGSFIENALDLCLSTKRKSRPGVPFRPIKAVGLDLFPHTPHTELVVRFER